MASEIVTADSADSAAAADRSLFYALEKFHAYPFTEDREFKIGLAALLKKRVPSPTANAGQSPSSQEVNAAAQLPELTEEDLSRNDAFVTKAKLFYYSKKHGVNPPLSLSAYQAFLASGRPGSSQEGGNDHASGLPTSERVAEGDSKTAEENKNGSTVSNVDTTERKEAATTPPLSSSGTASHGDKDPVQSAEEQSSSDSIRDGQPQEQPTYPSSFAHIVELITTGQPVPGIQEIPNTVLKGKETKANASRRTKPWEKSPGNPSDRDDADKILDLSDVTPSVYANPNNESNKTTDTLSGGEVTEKQDTIEVAEDEEHKPSTDDTSSQNETEPNFAPY